MWLSDVSVSPVVAGDGERCRCGCQHASSRWWLIWVRSRTQEVRLDRWLRWQGIGKGDAYIFSWGVVSLHAHTRHDPPQMASVAEDQPMYRPSPISYLRHGHTWARGRRRHVPSGLCRLTLSRGKTGRRTAAWCWLHTKTRRSWCRCLQHKASSERCCWGLCFHCKVDSTTYKTLCRCKEVVFRFMEPTQTCEQHLIHLSRCLVLQTGCSPFPDVLKTCLPYAPPGPAPLPCSRKNTPPIAAILPFRR